MNNSPVGSPPSQPGPVVYWAMIVNRIVIVLAHLAFFLVDLNSDYSQMLIPCTGPVGIGEECNFLAISSAETAALSAPLRRRVQAFIDRRFYRQKYDAQQVLAEFTETARDEVSLDALTAELSLVVQKTMQPERSLVVEQTMQPEQTSLWLKNSKGSKRS